jgi:SET domain-containing protein
MILPCLYIAPTDQMGRGVFTSKKLKTGTVIEIAPVIVMSQDDRKLLDQTLLHDYIFEWGEQHNQCCMALGYVPVYNHSYRSNCEYEMDYENDLITIKTVRTVKEGEELFINYNGEWNDGKKLWFEAVPPTP